MTSATDTPALPAGVHAVTRVDGTNRYRGMVNRPRVGGRKIAPLSQTFDTVELAAQWVERTLTDRAATAVALATSSPALTGRATLAQWAAAWDTGHLGVRTQDSYTQLISRHVLPAVGHVPVADLRPSQLAALWRSLAGQMSRGSLTKVRAATQSLLKAAISEGLTDVNAAAAAPLPTEHVAPTKRKVVRHVGSWPLEHVQKVLVDEQATKLGYAPVFALLAGTGLRISEALGLDVADCEVDADGTLVAVRVTRSVQHLTGGRGRTELPVKTRKAKRRVPVADRFRAVASELIGGRTDGPLIVNAAGRPRRADTINAAWRKVCTSYAAANGLTRIELHGLRHSVARALTATPGISAATASQWLGHSSLDFTVRVYADLDEAAADEAAALL
ncbi:MAG TPA: tyrosine-type recombinase/integrase [Nakamurella sp.]